MIHTRLITSLVLILILGVATLALSLVSHQALEDWKKGNAATDDDKKKYDLAKTLQYVVTGAGAAIVLLSGWTLYKEKTAIGKRS